MLKKANKVLKTSFEEEQKMKDAAFLKLRPIDRLRVHEEMRKRIWGDKYNKLSLRGLKVTMKKLS